jgi:isoleucyl-tRNA synthetase
MYEKVNTSLDFASREKAVLDFWNEQNIFEESMKRREGNEQFTFYDGPPTANGKPHIGHVLTRAVKDCIPRYKTMKGYHVLRKAGWDTHGLPVELEVEKSLNISGKPEIEKYGVEPFIQKCKESVWKYEALWRQMSERVGYWADMDKPYVTYHNEYIESVWWALSEIWKKGLIYKGYRVVPYCPRCGTPLSSHEVAQGYKDVKETSVYVKFKIKDRDAYLLAWTTTPWTLPSNVGLCVNERVEYARVRANGEEYVMASALVADVLGEGAEVIETVTGKRLEGTRYEPLFPYAETALNDKDGSENYCTVVCDDYVTLTDGTGIVHIAPAFGEDDSRVSKAYNLPMVQLVDTQGNFVPAVTDYAGMFVKEADPLIVKALKASGKLLKEKAYEHSYPFCWRCDTPLLYYARDNWYIQMSKLRTELMDNNNSVNWLPDNIRTGRFGNWLENAIDWSLSRERYWGTPLPIWECGCGHKHCVGSIAELKQMGRDVPDNIELHKPYIDEVMLDCPVCGGVMKRVPEVIDGWFDAGSMPFAQWHYPFENKELFDKQFPADFISEAIDQTRGWFYTLMAISTILFEKSPYKNVIVLGHVQDKNGVKLSKHLGNYVDPMEALEQFGSDAIRWYFYISSAPWLNNRFYSEAVSETQRKFMGTLWNAYAFYVLYAEIDQFNPYQHEADASRKFVMDDWIISRLNTLIKKVDDCLNRFEITEPARLLNRFVDDLSNWYVRRCRDRFWGNGLPPEKLNAYKTLHHVLLTLAKLSAPFVPFMSELIYRNLAAGLDKNAPVSVHLCDYPVADEALINASLEREMDIVLDTVVLGRAARNSANVKNRQPLAQMYVALSDGARPSDDMSAIILDELNVRSISYISQQEAEAYTTYAFKPQLRTLGPKYGKLVPQITAALNEDGAATMAALKAGTWKRNLSGVDVELTIDDTLIEIKQRDGYNAQSDRGVAVVLDIRLTPELIEEGNVRELVSKLQNMRKDAGFDVTDRIRVGYEAESVMSGVFERNKEMIAGEVLAQTVASGEILGAYAKEWNVNGVNVKLWVERI